MTVLELRGRTRAARLPHRSRRPRQQERALPAIQNRFAVRESLQRVGDAIVEPEVSESPEAPGGLGGGGRSVSSVELDVGQQEVASTDPFRATPTTRSATLRGTRP